MLFSGIDVGLLLTINVEQFEEVDGITNETGLLVRAVVSFVENLK